MVERERGWGRGGETERVKLFVNVDNHVFALAHVSTLLV